MNIFIIAGEPSGDLHGGLLAKALKELNPQVKLTGWGGDKMKEAGVEINKHIRELAFMGLGAVIKNLGKIFKNFSECKQQIIDNKIDTLVCIDYGGFNLRMARWAKERGLKVFYYISPQVWASRAGRVEKIRRYTDKMICIFPFEKEFYAQYGMEVEYVGHPLPSLIKPIEKKALERENIIALLPGSRKQELKKMLPIMLSATEKFPDYKFVIAAASEELFQNPEIKDLLKNYTVELVYQSTYALLSKARLAWVTSGTATLETALHGTPQLVCYRTEPLFYHIAKRIIKVPYISIVNIILKKEVVKELIQNNLNVENLVQETRLLLQKEATAAQLQEYDNLRGLLGNGDAALKAGKIILSDELFLEL